MESEKYPKTTFKGTVSGFYPKGGKQEVKSKGNLVLHGVSRTITSEARMEKIILLTSFPVQLKADQIKIPKVVFYNISKEMQVKINLLYKPYEKLCFRQPRVDDDGLTLLKMTTHEIYFLLIRLYYYKINLK